MKHENVKGQPKDMLEACAVGRPLLVAETLGGKDALMIAGPGDVVFVSTAAERDEETRWLTDEAVKRWNQHHELADALTLREADLRALRLQVLALERRLRDAGLLPQVPPREVASNLLDSPTPNAFELVDMLFDARAEMEAQRQRADNLRAEHDGAMEVDRAELAACAEKIATLERALADERETRAALEAQLVTLRGAAEIGTENERRLEAKLWRERHEASKLASALQESLAQRTALEAKRGGA